MSEETVGISLADIAAALQIIDVAAKRGAFEGSELTQVGTVRDRLVAFVIAQSPKEEETVEEATEEEEEETTE